MIAFFAPVPAAEGTDWLRLALQIFRSQWRRFTALASLFLFLLLVAMLLSLLAGGIPFVILLKPILSVGFLAATWHYERGEAPEYSHLFAGFKSNVKALLALGAVYVVCTIVISVLSRLLVGESWEQIVSASSNPHPMTDEVRIRFIFVVLTLSLPLTAALWFAPALIVFNDASFVQSLTLSLTACLRNWRAMLTYAVTMFFATVFTVAVCAPFLFFIQPLAPFVLMAVGIPLTAILMISDYVSYRRIFHRDERVEKVSGAQ